MGHHFGSTLHSLPAILYSSRSLGTLVQALKWHLISRWQWPSLEVLTDNMDIQQTTGTWQNVHLLAQLRAWQCVHTSPHTHPAVLTDDMTLDTTGVADTPQLLCLSSAAVRGKTITRDTPLFEQEELYDACRHLLYLLCL